MNERRTGINWLKNDWLQNLILLSVIFLFYRLTASTWTDVEITNLVTLNTLLPVIIPVYIINLGIVRLLIIRQKRYVLSLVLIILVLILASLYQFKISGMWGVYSYGVLMNFLIISCGMGLYMVKHSLYRLQEDSIAQKLQIRQLKAQINPHFLFNTLNNLYSDSLREADSVSESILILSDLMRYSLDFEHREQVKLKEEFDFLEHYIFLEKIRLSDDRNIHLNLDARDETLLIPPLLFLPLVENAFKHGVNSTIEQPYLDIEIIQDQWSIDATVKNKIANGNQPNDIYPGGMGLDILKKRLLYYYPNRHYFKVQQENDLFVAHLKLSL